MLSNQLVFIQGDRVWVDSQFHYRLSMPQCPTHAQAHVRFDAEEGVILDAYLMDENADCFAGLTALPMRELLAHLSPEQFNLLGRARQLLLFEQQYQFCHHCGHSLLRSNQESQAKQCSHCNALHYPRIDPCVIVAISKGEQILLASPHRIKGLYSVVAGFIEAGETLEQTIVREVAEETGVQIKNLRYFGSQPWPFQRNLMMGFTAEWASGTLQPDPDELDDAGWFSFDQLPNIAPAGTIARDMIEYLREQARP